MNLAGLRLEENKDIFCPSVGSRTVNFKNTSLSTWLTEELGGRETGHYHTDRDRLLNRAHPVRNVLLVSLGLHAC